MRIKTLTKRIKRRKMLLNFLLKFLAPTNALTVYLSQNLDTHIVTYQNYLAKRYNRKKPQKCHLRLTA